LSNNNEKKCYGSKNMVMSFFLPGEYGDVCYADAHTCHKEKRNLASEESAELDAL
jgi:hypothetical protein